MISKSTTLLVAVSLFTAPLSTTGQGAPSGGAPATACNNKSEGDACSYTSGGGPNAGKTSSVPAAGASVLWSTLILLVQCPVQLHTPDQRLTKRANQALLPFEEMLDVLIRVLSRFVPKEKLDAPCLMPPTFTVQWRRDFPRTSQGQRAWLPTTAFPTLSFREESTRTSQRPSCTRHVKIEAARLHKLCWITAAVMQIRFITTSA